LLWEKGIGEFIDAARMLRAQGRTIEFVIAGSPDPGNPRSASREQAQAWVTEGLVDWRGHVEDMPSLMRTMDVICLPSYYREGVPKSLIEAAACGLAVVTTNLPGCREVVSEDGVDGLHVEPRCARSLAERLAMLDDDRVLVRRLGDEARRKAMEHFDEQMVIRRTIEVYDELLPSRGIPSRAAA
jgi:glycosyltransferase involved in cell wall biosynthesis